jgi:hypothetical protein
LLHYFAATHGSLFLLLYFYYWINMSAMDWSVLWMLLNGWFAKRSFEQEHNLAGWFCLIISAWYLAEILKLSF